MLIVICGLPGTGKSVTARQIASDINAIILRTDSIRKEMFRRGNLGEVLKSSNPLQFDLESIFDRQRIIPKKFQRLIWKQKELVYDGLFKRVSKLLLKCLNLVLDATLYKKSLREKIYNIARGANSKVFLIECVCSEKAIRKRFKKRSKKPDRFSYVDKIRIFQKMKERFEDPLDDKKPTIIYDTGRQKIKFYNFSNEDKEELEKLRGSLKKLILKFS